MLEWSRVFLSSLLIGEQPVQGLAGVLDDRHRLFNLRGLARHSDLLGGGVQPLHFRAQV